MTGRPTAGEEASGEGSEEASAPAEAGTGAGDAAAEEAGEGEGAGSAPPPRQLPLRQLHDFSLHDASGQLCRLEVLDARVGSKIYATGFVGANRRARPTRGETGLR